MKYRLLKELPDAVIGTILEWDENKEWFKFCDKYGANCFYDEKTVINNPDWFEKCELDEVTQREMFNALDYCYSELYTSDNPDEVKLSETIKSVIRYLFPHYQDKSEE